VTVDLEQLYAAGGDAAGDTSPASRGVDRLGLRRPPNGGDARDVSAARPATTPPGRAGNDRLEGGGGNDFWRRCRYDELLGGAGRDTADFIGSVRSRATSPG
jgi:hypothetical protein